MKYEFTGETITYSHKGHNITLYRIKATIDISKDVHAGDLGGWIQEMDNLSQVGECWVYDNSMVFAKGWVRDNAQVRGNSIVCDKGLITDNSIITDTYVGCRCVIARDTSKMSFGKDELKSLVLKSCYVNNYVDDYITIKGVGEVEGKYMIVGGIYTIYKKYKAYHVSYQYDYIASKKREKEDLERRKKR